MPNQRSKYICQGASIYYKVALIKRIILRGECLSNWTGAVSRGNVCAEEHSLLL